LALSEEGDWFRALAATGEFPLAILFLRAGKTAMKVLEQE
jgi:hypothetical protein